MPEALSNLLGKITDFWGGLDTTKKIIFGAIVGVVLISFALMGSYSKKPAQELLYGDLSASDYSAITKQLEASGYEYSGSGTSTIYVDGLKRQEIVTKLAQENLIPAGVEGWQLFNMSRWDETTLDKDVKLHRAVKGSLEQMLMSLDYVKK
ncbi:MAG: flagellar M-ring protein FliF, partial [Leptonema sp. (in: Bacteria)]|nr:flagellar M-ring protein FliF [Leptonema sp. (in: bacteria)]